MHFEHRLTALGQSLDEPTNSCVCAGRFDANLDPVTGALTCVSNVICAVRGSILEPISNACRCNPADILNFAACLATGLLPL